MVCSLNYTISVSHFPGGYRRIPGNRIEKGGGKEDPKQPEQVMDHPGSLARSVTIDQLIPWCLCGSLLLWKAPSSRIVRKMRPGQDKLRPQTQDPFCGFR